MNARERFEDLLGMELENEITDAERAELSALLAAHPEWEEDARREREMIALLRRAGRTKAPVDLVATAMAGLERDVDKGEPRRRGFPPAFALLAAASICGVLVGGAYLLNDAAAPVSKMEMTKQRGVAAELPVGEMAAQERMIASDAVGTAEQLMLPDEAFFEEQKKELAKAQTPDALFETNRFLTYSNAAVGGSLTEAPASAQPYASDEGKVQNQAYFRTEEARRTEPVSTLDDATLSMGVATRESGWDTDDDKMIVTEEPAGSARGLPSIAMAAPAESSLSEVRSEGARRQMTGAPPSAPSESRGDLWRMNERPAAAAAHPAPSGQAARAMSAPKDEVRVLFANQGGRFVYETDNRNLALTGEAADSRRKAGEAPRYLVYEFDTLRQAEDALRNLKRNKPPIPLNLNIAEIVARENVYRLIIQREEK